jgi:HTH-type transcriptional regulator/antitoxin HigA
MRRLPALAIDYVDKNTNHKVHLPISVFKKPSNDKEYNKLQLFLDKLIDEVRGNETHPLSVVMEIIVSVRTQYPTSQFLRNKQSRDRQGASPMLANARGSEILF